MINDFFNWNNVNKTTKTINCFIDKNKKKLNVDLNDCRVLKIDKNENEKKSFKTLLINQRRKRVERKAFFNLKNVSSIEKLSLLLYVNFCVDVIITLLKKRKKSNFLYDLITLQKLCNILTNARNDCYFFNQFIDSFNSFLTIKRSEWILNFNKRK